MMIVVVNGVGKHFYAWPFLDDIQAYENDN